MYMHHQVAIILRCGVCTRMAILYRDFDVGAGLAVDHRSFYAGAGSIAPLQIGQGDACPWTPDVLEDSMCVKYGIPPTATSGARAEA